MPTNSFYENAYAQQSGDPFISLIRVNVDGTYYYYANDNVGHTSNVSGSSQFYQKAAFNLSLPEDKTEGTPTAKLEFDAGDIQIIRLLREAEEKITLDLWVVLGTNVNIAEFGPASYESEKFTIKDTTVSMELIAEPILDIQFPGYRFTPETFPSLWREQFEV
jgi:hypothetical protein